MGKLNQTNAFTVIELMLSLAIFSIIIVITYTSLTTHSTISKSQEDSLVVSQNIRVITDIIANHIRMAGFGTKYSLSYQTGNSVNGYTQVFNAVDGDSNGSDKLTVVYASRLVGSVAKDNSNSSQYSGYRIFIHSNKINLLNSGRKRYVFFERNPFNQFFQLTSTPNPVAGGKYLLTFSPNVQIDAYENDKVYSVRAISIYYNDNNEEIMISENTGGVAQVLASNIETIQFQYGIDEDGDGILDDTDNDGNGLDNIVPPNKEKFLKIVKLSILARASHPDENFKSRKLYYSVGNYRITLDRNDSNGITSKYDWHYRRKVVVVYISPRNYENELF